MVLFKVLAKTGVQAILSAAMLLLNVEVITWMVLAFWCIRLALYALIKESERRVVYVYKRPVERF